MTNWARVSTLCASTNLLTIPELLLDYSPSTDRIMIDHGTQSSRNSNNNSRRIPKHRIPLLCTITSRTYSFGSSSDTLQQQHHSHLRNSNHDRDPRRKRWQQERLADTGDGCHGKPHDNTLDTKTPRHNPAITRQIHRTQVLCQPSNNHHQRLQQHIHDPQREPDRNQGTSHRRRLPHLWRRNDDSPAGPVVQQQRDHEQPNHDSDASRNSQTSVEGGRARGSTRAYEGSTWPWCLRASLKLIFYKKIDYQPGLTASMVFIVFSRVGIRPGPGSRGDAPMPGGRACVLRRRFFRSIRSVCSVLFLCRTCRTLSSWLDPVGSRSFFGLCLS